MDRTEYERRRRGKEAEKRRLERERRKLIQDRDDLQYYYDRLDLWKTDCKNLSKSLARMPEGAKFWRGNVHDQFTSDCDDMAAEAEDLAWNIDAIMDEVNWEINRINDKIRQNKNLINSIIGALADLATMFENATN